MFEIPDDDDNFWEDLPLNDISNEHENSCTRRDAELQKTLQGHLGENSVHKRRCVTGLGKVNTSDAASVLQRTSDRGPNRGYTTPGSKEGQKAGPNGRYPTHGSEDGRIGKLSRILQQGPCLRIPSEPSRVLVPSTQEALLSEDPFVNRPRTPSGNAVIQNGDATNSDHNLGSYGKSNKRKRKFPGPAGLLPRLGQGDMLDSPDVSCKMKVDAVSPEQVIERSDVILSSQSGEEVFSERAWQTLMTDLEHDGQDTLHRFSLASSLHKAKKKLLPRGKVPFVMAVIETLEWQGGDASVTLKDKSGKIQGTIHQSLMKEYECDLQPGSVLVLRQVSVISPTSRNHYLNITPANMVSLYCISMDGLNRVRFLDKDKPLPSVLKELEQEMMADVTPQGPRRMDKNIGSTHRTPGLSPGVSYSRTPPVRMNSSVPDGAKTGVPGVGLSGLQGISVTRSGNFTPQKGPGQIFSPSGVSGARTPGVGVTTPGVGGVRPQGVGITTPGLEIPRQHGVRVTTPGVGMTGSQGMGVTTPGVGNARLQGIGVTTPGVGMTRPQGMGVTTPGVGMTRPQGMGVTTPGVGVTRQQAVGVSGPGHFTPQRCPGQNFTPQRFSTPDPKQRNMMTSNCVVSQGPGNMSYSGAMGRTTPQTSSYRLQTGDVSGNRDPTTTPVTRVSNPYRFTPQANTFSNTQSNVQRSEASFSSVMGGTPKTDIRNPLSSTTCPGGVVSSVHGTNSQISEQCPVSRVTGHGCSAGPVGLTHSVNATTNSTTDVCRKVDLVHNSHPSNTSTPSRKGFKFKPTKSLTSPDNTVCSIMGQKPPTISGESGQTKQDVHRKANFEVENLWQDDLSDDLLSQLSDELV